MVFDLVVFVQVQNIYTRTPKKKSAKDLVSDVIVEKVADHALVWINRLLAIDHDIAIKRDRKVSTKGILILWVVSFIGMLFNFLTLIYIGVMLSLLVPPLYEKYQDEIDQKVGVAHSVLSRHIDTIITRTRQSTK
uniref:Reticulon-like protein n=2 Tax=Zea mays TaxID=4577 RepID=A0A804NTW4_MAIZE